MTTYKNVWIGIVAVNLLAFFRPATGQMVLPAQSTLPSPEAREQVVLPAQYEGRWEVQANGDVKATRKYTLPMQMYRMWKAADAPMLEARSFSSGRSSLEVTGKKADWDDLNRTLIFTMTEMGAFQNKGDHWEGKMPLGHEFSNLDETRKIAFFHFTAAADIGQVQGQDQVILPPDSVKPSWDASARVIRYTMPASSTMGESSRMAMLLSAVCFGTGILMWIASFIIGGRKLTD